MIYINFYIYVYKVNKKQNKQNLNINNLQNSNNKKKSIRTYVLISSPNFYLYWTGYYVLRVFIHFKVHIDLIENE